MTFNLGYQIPNFSYGTGVAELYPTVIAQAQEADAAGFDSVFVMDHLYQLPMLGSPDEPMLEAYTALGGLATATEPARPEHQPSTTPRRCSSSDPPTPPRGARVHRRTPTASGQHRSGRTGLTPAQ